MLQYDVDLKYSFKCKIFQLVFGKAQFEGCQCMSVTQNHFVMHKS